MTEEKLKLFEFSELGFFAARDKDHAFALCEIHTGMTTEELDLDNDFKRVVPDDEEIDVSAEDSWEDPRERTEAVVAGSRFLHALPPEDHRHRVGEQPPRLGPR